MSTFKIGDSVKKKSGSSWEGRIVGTYSTELTPEGYAVESFAHKGSVQIYPANAVKILEEQPSECNDNDSPWLVCKPCVATGKCAKAEQPSVREPLTAALNALEENARLLGITQARKEFGTYSQDDARFERAFYEGIYKHRRAIEAMHGIGVKGEA